MSGRAVDGMFEGGQAVAGVSQQRQTASRLASVSIHAKLLILIFLVSIPLVNPWVRGDGVGYYAYLRSALIDHDLRFENDWLQANPSFVMSRVDAQGHLLPQLYTSTGYVGNHFSVGPAILWAPVVIPVHWMVLLLDRAGAQIPADGYSHPYVLSMALATALYGFLSLYLGFLMARKYFDPRWAFLSTLGIWMASSLPVYMYFNPSWSHAHSAFAVALFLWYWDRTRLGRTTGQWAVLGALGGLMGNIYYPNVLVLAFPAFEILYLLRDRRRGAQREIVSLGQLALRGAVFGGVFLISSLPTFVTRQILYGSPFVTGYPPMRTWNWTSPALAGVLFSSDHGIWSWTPILFFSVLGLVFLRKRDALMGTGALVAVVAFYYFIASYPDWDGLSSYGNRFFVSLTPIFILGLACLLHEFSRWVGKASRAATVSGAAIALFVLWNCGLMFQWGTHLVPARGKISWSEMVRNQFTAVPVRVTHALETYFLHRSAMMQHIEQEDIEQQKGQQ